MSQRTPSHWSAIDVRVSITAVRSRGVERVELHHVRPGREVRVPAVGEDPVTDLDERARVRVPGPAAVPGDEQLRPVGHPGMVGGDVVGHEVQDQPHPAGGQRGPGRGQPVRSAQVVVDDVVADAVRAIRRRPPVASRAGRRRRRPVRSGLARAMAMPAGLRCQTPISQTASNPSAGQLVPAPAGHGAQGRRGGPRPGSARCSHGQVLIS